MAYEMAAKVLPMYSSRFSRKDYTFPQLYACLILKAFFDMSYRGIEAFLRDVPEWYIKIGLQRVPDHNTLRNAFAVLTTGEKTNAMMDRMAKRFDELGWLNLHEKPLCIDSTHFEKHVVSRHFEKRRNKGLSKKTTEEKLSEAVRSLPKLALGVAASCHAILSLWTTTGMGCDSTHLWPVTADAVRRVEVKTVVADAGYDGEKCLEILHRMGVRPVVPPLRHAIVGGPQTPLRAQMWRDFQSGAVASIYGQRWQVETVNSMLKRNFGSALRSRSPQLREQEMMLKASLHNIALLWPSHLSRV